MRRSVQEKEERRAQAMPEYPEYPEPGEEAPQPAAVNPKKEKKEKKEKRARAEKPPKAFRATLGDRLRSRVAIGVLCILAGLFVGFVAFPASQMYMARRVPVVVAAAPVDKGTLLTADLLRVTEIGETDRPRNAVQGLEQAVGSYSVYAMLEGDVVTAGKVSSERPLSNPYLYDLPEDKVAISVSVPGLAEGLTAKLKAGDIVSVYAVFSGASEDDYVSLQPPELKYVPVLAVSNSAGLDVDVDEPVADSSGNERMPATLTLLVGDYQAAALAGLDRNATIHIGLVARATDEERCAALLAGQEEYIRELEAELELDPSRTVVSAAPQEPEPAPEEAESGGGVNG